MTKPSSKIELQDLCQSKFLQLIKLIDEMSEKSRSSDFKTESLNRNIRDVLAHLHAWHLLFLDWYTTGMQGAKPDMPAKSFTWRTMPALNVKIWKDGQQLTLNDALVKLKRSHLDLRNIIEKHSEEELFTKKRYAWTGSTSLGVYIISNTSSHYQWAIKLIKKSI